MKLSLIVLLLSVSLLGCSSSRSTLVERNASDSGWNIIKCLDGVPITVEVPTHIKIEITEHRYLSLQEATCKDDGTAELGTGDVEWLDPNSLKVPERSISHEIVKSSKIFTVDPKRPAAGTIESELTFGGANGQYFDKVDYAVSDTTIAAVQGLLSKVATQGLFGVPTSEGRVAGDDINKLIHRVDNVVASGLFNLDAPDVELQISEFLESHLNRCHDCTIN